MIESYIDYVEHPKHGWLEPIYNFIVRDVSGNILAQPIFDNSTSEFY